MRESSVNTRSTSASSGRVYGFGVIQQPRTLGQVLLWTTVAAGIALICGFGYMILRNPSDAEVPWVVPGMFSVMGLWGLACMFYLPIVVANSWRKPAVHGLLLIDGVLLRGRFTLSVAKDEAVTLLTCEQTTEVDRGASVVKIMPMLYLDKPARLLGIAVATDRLAPKDLCSASCGFMNITRGPIQIYCEGTRRKVGVANRAEVGQIIESFEPVVAAMFPGAQIVKELWVHVPEYAGNAAMTGLRGSGSPEAAESQRPKAAIQDLLDGVLVLRDGTGFGTYCRQHGWEIALR
jgi:hypothetical protein